LSTTLPSRDSITDNYASEIDQTIANKVMPAPGYEIEDFQYYTWRITGWSGLEKRITSPEFEAGGWKWRILLFPFGDKTSDNVSIYLDFADTKGAPAGWHSCVQFALLLWNSEDPTSYISHNANHCFTAEESGWGFRQFNDLRKLFVPSWWNRTRPLIENDACNITAFVRIIMETEYLKSFRKNFCSKEELSERLHAYFEKRKVGETDGGNEKPKVDTGVDNGDDFDAEGFVDLEGDDIDAESQEADGKVRDEFAARFPGKGKIIETTGPHEYDFLTKIGRHLDRAIRMLSSWSVALQIVRNNDKIMGKYKDRIPLAGQVEPMFRASNWGYQCRSKYRQQKRKRYSSPSDSERGELYKKGKKRDRGSYPFRGKESFNFAEQGSEKYNAESQLSVVGKMQTSEALNYWRQKIVPRQYMLSAEQVEWVQKELIDLEKCGLVREPEKVQWTPLQRQLQALAEKQKFQLGS
ncbi:22534_t:CDS:10, partial [Gigaspora margarita]